MRLIQPSGKVAARGTQNVGRRSVLIASLILVFMGLQAPTRTGSWRDTAGAHASAIQTTTPAPVLLELFTSEGCSSCPPADKLLTELEQTQPVKGALVIALSEHVDYWNRLGWKDPFSSADFSRRQGDYARALGLEDVYTPQMIVDGTTEFVGARADKALKAISDAARLPKAKISLSAEAAMKVVSSDSLSLKLQAELAPGQSSGAERGATIDVMLAITESRLSSKVSRGENSGRELLHSSVTRKLTKIASMEGSTFSAEPTVRLDSKWKRDDLKVVIFLQERSSRRVLGAAAIKLPPVREVKPL
jgi:hypothetical protein